MSTQIFKLSQEQRDRLLQEIGNLLKERGVLQQSVREQQVKATTASEELFLELLEVVDTLEFLLNYVANHEPSPQSWERLPKSLASIEKKLLMILERRQVNSIEFSATQPDFTLCRVVDREVRSDLENQTITKVVRRGFRLGNKLLRPIEVITSKTE